MCDFLNTFLGVVAGAAIAWIYYKRAGDQLRVEAQALHTAVGAIVYLLEHPKAKVEVQRNEQGRVSGLTIAAEGQATMAFTLTGPLLGPLCRRRFSCGLRL